MEHRRILFTRASIALPLSSFTATYEVPLCPQILVTSAW